MEESMDEILEKLENYFEIETRGLSLGDYIWMCEELMAYLESCADAAREDM
jgi:hypothetical protein